MPGQSGYAVGWGALALINAGLAQGKGRSGLLWFVISLLLGPLATLFIVLLPMPGVEARPLRRSEWAVVGVGVGVVLVLLVISVAGMAVGTPAPVESTLSGSAMVAWIVGLTLFFGLVLALFFVITRGTRAILGPRRRLEEDLGLEVLRTRLARGEISQAEFEQAKRVLGA